MEHLQEERYKDYLSIRVYPESKLIHTCWLRTVSSGEFRAGLLHLQAVILQQQLELWLLDANHLAPPDVLDQKWTIEKLLRSLEEAKLRKIALILPDDPIFHMLGESMKARVYSLFSQKILLDCFSRTDHARYWLLLSSETEDASPGI